MRQLFHARTLKCGSTPSVTDVRIIARCSSTLAAFDLNGRKFRIAVVGSGPAGFYATSKLLSFKGTQNVRVDMFEELPVPFGLVRFGVAPDHPQVKNCVHKFEETAEDPRFRYFGNVQVGAALDATQPHAGAPIEPPAIKAPPASHATARLPLEYLREHYDAVLLSYGASFDRPLRIPGEADLDNIHAAREFVHFYNGHPYANLPRLDLAKAEHATIIGLGNVAFDCTRMLLTSVDKLAKTDMTEAALAELRRSTVKHVELVGRRGPAHIRGTIAELRELLQMSDVRFEVERSEIVDTIAELEKEELRISATQDTLNKMHAALPPEQKKATPLRILPTERARLRLLRLLRDKQATTYGSKSWTMKFFRSPAAFHSDDERVVDGPARVKQVEWTLNQLVDGATRVDGRIQPAQQAAVEAAKLGSHTDLVLKSVGYRSIGIHGLPFDELAGIVRNENGRVIDDSGNVMPGLYTAGWLARGPTGVIATTMVEAFMIAENIATDAMVGLEAAAAPEDVNVLLKATGRPVTWTDWKRIDEEERERGARLGKPREKFTSIPEMLALLDR